MTPLSKIASLLGIVTVLGSVLMSFAVQMERLNTLRDDVKELKAGQQQLMIAVGMIENKRWRHEQNVR